MKANQAHYPVRVMCRLLRVSQSGFYAWEDRPLSARAREDIGLTALIHGIHRRSRGAYGAPSIHAELAADDHGIHVGCKRVARLMRAAGLFGATLQRFIRTTVTDPAADRAQDLVDRQFKRMGRTDCGSLISPTFRPGRVFCTWRWCWMSSRAGSWAGRWKPICAPSWC